ncbi:hypothetical protein VHEMI08469 [[Torrubiella] hemipterigena]|uniref:Alpha and gamma adaptin binding protein p34 n=1 Tax=[Torrubiella] hemipterigena TaxID=1531966 RepID=A0A0A1TN89_9HYPO|nr:hypothetical protein VHEMI08469 [[Torrubiella] hemipterigena]
MHPSATAEVRNPRRILAVSLQDHESHLLRVITELTGTSLISSSPTAGSSHTLNLKTRYYKASIPLWLDLIESPVEWSTSFLSSEATEVLSVLGGIILVFATPEKGQEDKVRDLIQHVGQVVHQGLGGWEWDGVKLAVGVGEGEGDEWDELCAGAGIEYVQIGGSRGAALQEFGEKSGVPRIIEALEANDWAQPDEPMLSELETASEATTQDHDHDLDPDNLDFGFDKADMEGLRRAIWGFGDADPPVGSRTDSPAPATTNSNINTNDGTSREAATAAAAAAAAAKENEELTEDDIAKVESMMRRLQAARETGQGMSEAERKRFAARAVREVMKDL